ncbi:MAG: hypothetical protein LKF15_02910 [Lachnospiraceae bacterium]|jgi:hypothetical protein|nr:hypothetical protein [Lachnospiraceae bacterium]MCH4027905.1 hypothetical protein [Lachnospiraceae bacterium]MCH4065748.1 hypothetical protein [Lachnospiraceae bacterium]MCH4111785.1 hypothetical protein [Lachnospiraceae bacterium]
MDPYERLANAIILQAVRDWRIAVRRLKRHPYDKDAKAMKEETEKFFFSQWFTGLTSISGEKLLTKLKEEAGIS